MPEDLGPRESLERKVEELRPPNQLGSGTHPSEVAPKCCAYNQTRHRFLSADVEAGDFPPAILNDRVPALTAESGRALWILPFRGISPTCVRVPIDLLLLDEYGAVIETVESFPIFQLSPSGRPAGSVLALPPGTITSTGTTFGDRLFLGTAEEMKRHLSSQQASSTNSPAMGPSLVPRPADVPSDDPANRAAGKVLSWVDTPPAKPSPTIAPEPSQETYQTAPAPAVPPPAPEGAPRQAWQPKPAKSKNWLQRFLDPEPEDPRKAPRHALPHIVAYFFTGGTPVPHSLRDISATGMYVLTKERWSPGTIMRTTLTDRRDPSTDRSITVNAKVIRWGNDGVGLQFVLADEKSRRSSRNAVFEDSSIAVNREQIEQFLLRIKSIPG